MGDLSRFLKVNKAVKENVFYKATKSLTDENGEPLPWEIKPISTKENEQLQESSTIDVAIPGKRGQTRPKIKNAEYLAKLMAASVVEPDLYNAELQDSYGVKTPEALIKEMIDNSGEWNDFVQFVNEFNGFVSLEDNVEEAKN